MRAFGEFKAVWDPGNQMNPHKLVDAYLPTENLRLGADYRPAQPDTFSVSRTTGIRSPRRRCAASAWANAASTTPARCARATWRRSRSATARAGARACCGNCCRAKSCGASWKDEDVKEALDLCLSCKACKSDCPTNVDIATYRAEFLSHYYETQRASAPGLCVRSGRPLGRARLDRAAHRQSRAKTPGIDAREALAPPCTSAGAAAACDRELPQVGANGACAVAGAVIPQRAPGSDAVG